MLSQIILVLGLVVLHFTLCEVTQNIEVATEFSNINSSYSTNIDITEDDCESSNSSHCDSSSTTVTTKVPRISTSVKPPKFKFEKKIGLIGGDSICSCNLQKSTCDLNCCCDPDCSYEMKKVFNHCANINENINVDTRLCEYVQYDYVNFFMKEWNVYNNDLFCVVRRSSPPTYTIQRKNPLKFKEALLEKDLKYAWPVLDEKDAAVFNFSQPYLQGDPLWIIVDNTTVTEFKVSDNFISSGCNIQKNVKFLENVKHVCIQNINSGFNNYLDANFYKNLFFIINPVKVNYTFLKKNLMNCSSEILSQPNISLCSDVNLKMCESLNNSNSSVPQLKCSKNNVHCENVVKSLKFTIFHKGIDGIKSVNLSMNLISTSNVEEIDQTVSVFFEWENSPFNFSNKLSGNPGYLVQEPILIGNLINDSIIERNPDNYLDNFMVLPEEENSICTIDEDSYQPIEFGFNTILSCRIQGNVTLTNTMMKKNVKPIDVCVKIQNAILEYWNIRRGNNGEFRNTSYGQFGNANVSILSDWREIMYGRSPKKIVSEIAGKFLDKNETLNCFGLVHNLDIDIYHARVDLKKVVNQEKILGIVYRFQGKNSTSFTFKIDKKTKVVSYEFELNTRISFWDITSPKFRKAVDPPSLNIKLPSDFFYPFVKVENGADGMVSNSISYTLVFLFLIILVSN